MIKISEVRHPWDETERTPYLKVISTHEISLSVIEGIRRVNEALRDDVVSRMIEWLTGRQ